MEVEAPDEAVARCDCRRVDLDPDLMRLWCGLFNLSELKYLRWPISRADNCLHCVATRPGALSYAAVTVTGYDLGDVFYGFYALAIGYVVFKSTFLPRAIGQVRRKPAAR